MLNTKEFRTARAVGYGQRDAQVLLLPPLRAHNQPIHYYR